MSRFRVQTVLASAENACEHTGNAKKHQESAAIVNLPEMRTRVLESAQNKKVLLAGLLAHVTTRRKAIAKLRALLHSILSDSPASSLLHIKLPRKFTLPIRAASNRILRIVLKTVRSNTLLATILLTQMPPRSIPPPQWPLTPNHATHLRY